MSDWTPVAPVDDPHGIECPAKGCAGTLNLVAATPANTIPCTEGHAVQVGVRIVE